MEAAEAEVGEGVEAPLLVREAVAAPAPAAVEAERAPALALVKVLLAVAFASG